MSAGATGTVVAEDERLARVTVSLIAEPGEPVLTGLADELGGIGCLEALRNHADRHEQLRAASARLEVADPAAALSRAADLGIRFLVPGDEEWPVQLADLVRAGAVQERGGPPVGLWVKGPFRLDRLATSVAVVGSRSATEYGDRVAGDIAAQTGHAGVAVVSGAAFGIDYAAHRGAVSAGAPTVAVLACGVDRAYPAAHRDLLDHLGAEHAVVSEAPLGAAPHRVRFLARNRLIAALTRGTVVVEAAARSGALSTMGWADRLHRVVMGVPGPVTSASSVGVHQRIRSGAATLVTSGSDVLELIGAPGEHLTEEVRGPDRPRDALRVKERQVLDAVPLDSAAPCDSVARVAGLDVVEVRGILDRLRDLGLAELDPVGWHLTEEALR